MNEAEMAKDIINSPHTEAAVFIARKDTGEIASFGIGSDEDGDSEAELLGDYVAAISARTGRSCSDIINHTVAYLNEHDGEIIHDQRGGA